MPRAAALTLVAVARRAPLLVLALLAAALLDADDGALIVVTLALALAGVAIGDRLAPRVARALRVEYAEPSGAITAVQLGALVVLAVALVLLGDDLALGPAVAIFLAVLLGTEVAEALAADQRRRSDPP